MFKGLVTQLGQGVQAWLGAPTAANLSKLVPVAYTTDNLSVFAPTTSAQLAGIITDEVNGSGGVLPFQTSGSDTPVLTFGGGSTGITYSTQTINWVRIGNIIIAWFFIVLTSKGSSTGLSAITIGALPAPAFATAFAIQGNNFAATVSAMQGAISAASTAITPQFLVAGAATQMTDAHFQNNSTLRMTLCYSV